MIQTVFEVLFGRRLPANKRWFRGAQTLAALTWLALIAIASITGLGCDKATPEPQPKRSLTVFAAASLRDVFKELAAGYQRVAPDVEVSFNFAGTQELRTQVEQGAKVDVFAGADTKHVAELVRQGLARPPVIFAENEPVLLVGSDAWNEVKSFADLVNAQRIVLGTAEVPIGRYSVQILDKANGVIAPDFRSRVEAHVVSRELNVRQVLAKVTMGEAQAGIVYRTDAAGVQQDKAKSVAIPPEINVVASYPIAITAVGSREAEAKRWIDFVLSDAGRQILVARGFQVPVLTKSAL